MAKRIFKGTLQLPHATILQMRDAGTLEKGEYYEATDTASAVVYIAKDTNALKEFGEGDGDKHYTHLQTTPLNTWVIVHNLQKRPVITVYDSAGTNVLGYVTHDNLIQATITFSASFSGYADCN